MKYCLDSRRKRLSHVQQNWIGHVLRRNCHQNSLLKEMWKGWKEEEEDVSILEKITNTGIERGNISSHFLENCLWKSISNSLKRDYVMMIKELRDKSIGVRFTET